MQVQLKPGCLEAGFFQGNGIMDCKGFIIGMSKQSITLVLGVFAIMIMALSQARAGERDSVYSRLDLDECRAVSDRELGLPEPGEEEMAMDGGRWLCAGYDGRIVYVVEEDLRFFVSFGSAAMGEMAAGQTFVTFNNIGDTLEWRVERKDGKWVPFATILRWTTEIGDGSQPDGSFLVVTGLEPGNVCQVARINASVIIDANRVAREIADNEVAGFDCMNDEMILVP